MRINKFVALATGLSRRAADTAIIQGRVMINQHPASPGTLTGESDKVSLDNQPLSLPNGTTTIILNKPAGYVCSRAGQGSQTVYDLLPAKLQRLKTVGRLDKDSSGLLMLTDDGDLANKLTHPRYNKEKIYEVELDESLAAEDSAKAGQGVKLDDGISKLRITNPRGRRCTVAISEGRNRQIRRTFEALGYQVRKLHRTSFGPYSLDQLAPTQSYKVLD